MIHSYLHFILLVLFVSSGIFLPLHNAYAQNIDTLKRRSISSFEGTHFYVGFLQNENFIQPNGIYLRLMISTSIPARVQITYPNGSPTTYLIKGNDILDIEVPSNLEMRKSSDVETITRNVIEIQSDVPVAVYCSNNQWTSSDSYAVIPTANWGQQYTVFSMPNDVYSGLELPNDTLSVRASEFMIIAANDNTLVEFNPAATTQRLKSPRQWYSITLNKGEAYWVKSSPTSQGTGDLTTSRVRANKPIAVLSGHVRSSVPVPYDQLRDSKDHLAEWLMPDEILGNEYISTPYTKPDRNNAGDYFKVVALQPNTRVQLFTERDDFTYTINTPNDVLTIPNINSPGWWVSDKPIAIMQYMYTGTVGTSDQYDPAMSLVAPTNKYVSRCLFLTPGNNIQKPAFANQFTAHYVNVVCDSTARGNITLDGVLVRQSNPEIMTQKFRGSNFFWTSIKILPGKHEIRCDSGVFSGVLYGTGYTDSYAHTLGFNTLPTYRDSMPPTITTEIVCGDITGVISELGQLNSSGINYASVNADSSTNYTWSFPNQLQSINRAEFTATVIDKLRDAKIVLESRDRAGNGFVYRYTYTAPRFTRSQSVQLAAASETDSVCNRLFFQNPFQNNIVRIESARVKNNPLGVLYLYSPRQYPIDVTQGQLLDFKVCFAPNGRSGLRLNDTVEFDIGCNRIVSIPISATSPVSSVVINDADFGEVLIGQTVCKDFVIKNTGTRSAQLIRVSESPALQHYTLNPQFLDLQPGDSVIWRICFTPTDTLESKHSISIDNSLGIPINALVKGKGIKPILSTNDIDYGNLRLEIKNDKTVTITNTGNAVSTFRYSGQIGDATNFLHSLNTTTTFRLQPMEILEFPVRFVAKEVKSYSSRLDFETTYPLQPKISVTLSANGTLPEIETYRVWFDTIAVNSTKKLYAKLFSTSGNELLTIDQGIVESVQNDASAFRIPAPILSFQQVQPETVIFDTISFSPKTSGLFVANIILRNDANIAFIRKNSTIQISGFARDTVKTNDTITPPDPPDTIRFQGKFLTQNKTVLRCGTDSLSATITNTSTDTVRIAIIEYINTAPATTVASQVIPVWSRGQVKTLTYQLPTPIIDGTYRAQVRIIRPSPLLDTIISIDTVTVQSQRSSPFIKGVTVISTPDSLVNILVGGEFIQPIDVGEQFEIHATIPPNLYQPRLVPANTINVMFNDNGVVRTVPSMLSVVSNTFVIKSTNPIFPWQRPISLTAPLQWNVSIPVQTFYTGQSEGIIIWEYFSANACIEKTVDTVQSITQDVCAQELVSLNLDGFTIKAFPQPADSYVTIETYSDNNRTINLELIDIFGRKFFLSENLLLLNGKQSVNLSTEHLTSGIYTLKATSKLDTKQFFLIITR